ncbi:SGNH/GDSL hydrolase family protein [Blastococcus sp. TF02A-35]|uniref:SGNH/GDSL hydrolase family protein n=1 Tax=Blastococcus sp. TF02A-35 TaxID=2559612 RepID=UPI0010737C38|nr:SGNH/GDSL hydrolase family protein [Blastococcus sp. TF02A_35]TFV53730.1 SGNH/GDSL hydrolase family protein [Blastococcus sp. TF02A_35]
MLQGFERPPWWAVALMAVCTLFLAIGLPVAIDRGRVDPAERTAAGSPSEASPRATTSAPGTAAESGETNEERVRIAVLGDAYTAGSAMDSGEESRWPALLSEQFPWDVTSYAVGGTGFAAGREQAQSFADRVPEIVAARPEVVVVAGGHDDVNAPVAQVQDGVRRTLGELRAALPDARVLVVGVFWPGRKPAGVFAVNRALQTTSAEVGATFVDALNEGWLEGADPALVGPDGTYPTDAGHAALAQRIGSALVAAGVSTQL